MKKHGRYDLLTPEELLADCEVDGCSADYINTQFQRHRAKHKNDKRHKEKIETYHRKKKGRQ